MTRTMRTAGLLLASVTLVALGTVGQRHMAGPKYDEQAVVSWSHSVTQPPSTTIATPQPDRMQLMVFTTSVQHAGSGDDVPGLETTLGSRERSAP